MIGSDPKVSIIIPVYNCASYLGEALESVISQTYNDIEIIVVDDGSTDDSAKVAKKYLGHITYLYQENAGISAALNFGISHAKGDYFAFLDSDDIWKKNKLYLQMEIINTTPEIAMVFGYIEQFISPDLSDIEKSSAHCPTEPMVGYGRQAMLISKSDFFNVGEFDPKYSGGEFMDWYMRAKELGLQSHLLPQVVTRRRIHNSNTTRIQPKLVKDYSLLLKSALDRRRSK